MFFTRLFIVTFFLITPFFAQAKGRIALDFSYKGNTLLKTAGKGVVERGETILKEFGRGDIDTVISMTPTFEGNSKTESIHIEISVKNFRDGDLISETSPQVVTVPGQEATLSLKDETLTENFKLSLTAKTLQ